MDKNIIVGNELLTSKLYAIYDTESDRFVTSVWTEKFCHKILKLLKGHHPNLNMTRFELRERLYPEDLNYDNTVILVIDKFNMVVCWYHWENRHYTNAYDKSQYTFVKYTPPNNQDVREIYGRFNYQQWNGQGQVIAI
jgi:hypothetical protein